MSRLASLSSLLLGVFAAGFLFCGLLGCEDDRFALPEHQRQALPKEQATAMRLQKGIPTDLPPWTQIAKPLPGQLFQPEPVRLQGEIWMREGKSKVFEFYFRPESHLLARSVAEVADGASAFLRQWLDQPFSQRIQILLMPQADPSDRFSTWQGKRLAIPSVLPPQIPIYLGTDEYPYLSLYGRVSELIDLSARFLMTGTLKKDPKRFWRSIVIPAYFAFRGTCAMLDPAYDKTAMPKFREILHHVGRPTPQELKKYWKLFQDGNLEDIAQERAIRSAMALLAYLEDNYSRGVLAQILRNLRQDPKLSIWEAIQKVTEQDQSKTWQSLRDFYFPDDWKRALQ
jgi:hypothetical protein